MKIPDGFKANCRVIVIEVLYAKLITIGEHHLYAGCWWCFRWEYDRLMVE